MLMLVLISVTPACSLSAKDRGYQVLFKDSLILEETGHVLSGTINIAANPISIQSLNLQLLLPAGWKEMTPLKDDNFAAAKEKKYSFPFTILKTQKVVAGWDSIVIKTWSSAKSDTTYNYLHIHIAEKPSYAIRLINEEQKFAGEAPTSIIFSNSVRNTGNIDDDYLISLNNTRLGIDASYNIRLKSGQDTTVAINVIPKTNYWPTLNAETIQVKATSKRSGAVKYLQYKISRPRATISQNDVTHITLPVTIGGGVLMLGSKISYFGLIQGQLKAGDHLLSYSYRSKDFGTQAYTYQPNLFSLIYNYKRLEVAAGQITGPRNFFNTGQGASIRYHDNKGMTVSISAMKFADIPNVYQYRNNNIFGNIDYKIRKLTFSHRAETSFDTYYKVNSYLLTNEVKLSGIKGLRLSAFLGAGYEVKLVDRQGIKKGTDGLSGGYLFDYTNSKFHLLSNVRLYSEYFPGIYKGLQNQLHEAVYKLRSNYIGLSYSSNSLVQNTLKDTLYNTDYLTTNNSKYGFVLGRKSAKYFIDLRGGLFEEKGQVYALSNASYTDLNMKFDIGKASFVSFSSSNAFKLRSVDKPVYVTNTYGSLVTRFVGLTGSYNRIPQQSEKVNELNYTETINGGPSIYFNVFNKTLKGSIRYNIAKTLSETIIRHGIGAQVAYNSHRGNLTLGVSGFYPLKDPSASSLLPVSETRYGAMYLYKRINVPVKKIRLYDFSATLFEDKNNNRELDTNELVLSNAMVILDGKVLQTDANGAISYRKVTPGRYSMDFLNTNYNQLIPTQGMVQTIDLAGDVKVNIPFRKGRKIHGNIRIDIDSFSTTTLTPGNFKIIITDTSGKTYNSITDGKGDFYIFLSEGNYRVSLNPEAFNQSDFKPDKLSQDVELTINNEVFVQFNVRQKKRKVHFMNADKSK